MFDASELRTFKQIVEEFPIFTENSLRYLWDNRERKGMSDVFFKVRGRRMAHRAEPPWSSISIPGLRPVSSMSAPHI